MRAVSFAFAVLALAAASCTTTVNKVPQSSSGDGLPGGPRPEQPCAPGEQTFGIDAFDSTLDEGAGSVCDVGSVLDEDGNLTGLAGASGKASLDGHDVNGCVGVQFGSNIVLASLIMKMRPTSGMCGHECSEGDDGCGTGWKVGVYVGPSFEDVSYLQQLTLTTTDLFEYRVAVHKSYDARVAVICREATPETGDDVAIDLVSGLCGDPPK